MDTEMLALVQSMIAEAIKPLRMAIDALAEEVEQLENRCATETHYHDEYASVVHVERSEQQFRSDVSRVRDEISNVEYRVNEVGRKAERAQNTADMASRSSRGY